MKKKEALKPLTARERKDVELKVAKARTQIILDHPFIACVLLQRPLVQRAVGTMAIDARGTVYYDERFVNTLTVPEVVFCFAHEAMHHVLAHAIRMMGRDPRRWNWAGDAVINDMLIEMSVGSFIEGGVRMPGARNKTTDEVYANMPPPPPPPPGGKGDQPGNPGDQPGGGDGEQPGDDYGNGEGGYGIGDDLIDEPMSEAERSEAEANAKVELVAAAQAAKMQGKLPASIARIIEDMLAVKTPWYDILERYMVAMIRDDTSWRRPNKRFIGKRIYFPSDDTKYKMGTVCIQIDTSGSIGVEELRLFLGHINRIVEQCQPEEIVVLHTDARVAHEVHYTTEDLPIVIDKLYGGGGTDMTKGFAYIEEHQIDADVMITLTDGYTPFLSSKPEVPDIWLITTKGIESPTGVTIHAEADDAA